MKNILLQRIPVSDGESILSLEEVSIFHKVIKSILPEDYVLITSPMDIKKIDGDFKIINIDNKHYSANELMELIEKAEMYDGLCK